MGWLAGRLTQKILVPLPRRWRADSVRRGRQYYVSILSESFGFLQSGSQEHFEFRADWYRGGAVAALVLEYYVLLRSVLRAKPHLRACLTRCRHCRIFFLTHPRNAGRHDLRCPFGCRQAHRQQAVRATQRRLLRRSPRARAEEQHSINAGRASTRAPEPPSDRPRAPAVPSGAPPSGTSRWSSMCGW